MNWQRNSYTRIYLSVRLIHLVLEWKMVEYSKIGGVFTAASPRWDDKCIPVAYLLNTVGFEFEVLNIVHVGDFYIPAQPG